MSENNLIIGGHLIDTTTVSVDLLPELMNSPEVVKRHRIGMMSVLSDACKNGGLSISISATGEWFLVRADGSRHKGSNLESLVSELVRFSIEH